MQLLLFFFLILKSFIKYITLVWLTLLVIASIEAFFIFKNKHSAISFLRPFPIHKTYDFYPTITILYKLYCNFVFDIVFIRVIYKPSLFRLLSIKPILVSIALSYFGINRLFLKLVKLFFSSWNFPDLSDFLAINYTNPLDARRLYFYKNKWILYSATNRAIDVVFETAVSLKGQQGAPAYGSICNNWYKTYFYKVPRYSGFASDNLLDYNAGPIRFEILAWDFTIVVYNESQIPEFLVEVFPFIKQTWQISDNNVLFINNDLFLIRYNLTIITNYMKYLIVYI